MIRTGRIWTKRFDGLETPAELSWRHQWGGMETSQQNIDWAQIGARLSFPEAERFVEQEIVPLIEDIPVETKSENGKPKHNLELPFTIGMIGFAISFFTLFSLLPDNIIGGILVFVLFLPLFFGWIIAVIYLFRDRFWAVFLDGKARFLARSKALSALAAELDLSYVPSPGGAPAMLKKVAQHRFAPDALREAVSVIDDHGGLDEPLQVARSSGTMMIGPVLGSKEQREKYHLQTAENVRVEDGFQGACDGVPFSAFEWVESNDESPDTHHLVLVFDVPYRLHGVTQMRTRHIGWPGGHFDAVFADVDIVASAFRDRFRMRSTDQTEARAIFDPAVVERVSGIAHGEKVRAVAFDKHLVIDVEGEDRFAMVNLGTGDWSRETIANSMIHIADMLDLAKAVATAFRLRR
ncbi:MAG: hypothetical protein AAGJ84_13280 [Pseudomonadota bacterium]